MNNDDSVQLSLNSINITGLADQSKDNNKNIFIYDNYSVNNLLNSITQKKKRKRNFGIDVGRIISMIFLINHHIIHHGGPLFKTKLLSFDNNLLIYLNTLFSSGVNIFGMISGFVGFHGHNYSNLIYLLFQTFIYNYVIAFFYHSVKPNYIKDLRNFLYPLFISHYWYFDAYFSMYFFLPLINSGINSLGKKEMEYFCIIIFIIFSLLNQIKHYSSRLKKDFFHLNNGFNYIWLIILYVYGSYFGRFHCSNQNNNKLKSFLLYCSILLFATFLRNLIIIHKLKYYNEDDNMRVEYTSPSSVIISICFIILFSNMNVKNNLLQKIISFFAPLTFGIYLIHNHILVRNNYIRNNFTWLLKYRSIKLIIITALQSFKIFIFCSLIDYIRLLLFKIFRIRQLSILFNNLLGNIGYVITFLIQLFVSL